MLVAASELGGIPFIEHYCQETDKIRALVIVRDHFDYALFIFCSTGSSA